MVDPLTTSAAVATVLVGAKEIATSIVTIAKKTKNKDLEDRTVELLEVVRRAQALAVERATRADELEEENKALRKQLAQRSEMHQEEDVMYRSTGDGTKDGPFCLHCLLQNQREVRLVSGHESYAEYQCPSCKELAGTRTTPPPGVFVI